MSKRHTSSRRPAIRRWLVAIAAVCLVLTGASAGAQTVPQARGSYPAPLRNAEATLQTGRDSLANGILIGGGIGAVGGFIAAPYFFCGNGFEDSECATIVRVVIGIPALAGGLILGGVFDKLQDGSPLAWQDRSGRRTTRVDPWFGGRTAGARVTVAFR